MGRPKREKAGRARKARRDSKGEGGTDDDTSKKAGRQVEERGWQ
jgi:hypothetical protein